MKSATIFGLVLMLALLPGCKAALDWLKNPIDVTPTGQVIAQPSEAEEVVGTIEEALSPFAVVPWGAFAISLIGVIRLALKLKRQTVAFIATIKAIEQLRASPEKKAMWSEASDGALATVPISKTVLSKTIAELKAKAESSL